MRNILVAFLTLTLAADALAEEEHVSIYVSLDREHSERLITRFGEETGITVSPLYDTEKDKTVGLVRRLIEEKGDPQADVYWNNELATTIKLKENGVLQKFLSKSAADIPTAFRDPDGYWVGFAARARVLIVNTDLVGPDEMPTSMWDLTKPKWKGRICMARPQTGTTAAHAAALYVRDRAKADEYFDKLIRNDVVWLTGNAHCMRDVAEGRFAFGWTDTDDYNLARRKGKSVAMVYPDAGPDQAGVMYIPNSLVMIKNCKNKKNAQILVDWILRAEIEQELAFSDTAQIPVRPNIPVPGHVKRPDQIGRVMAVDWDTVGKEYDKWVEHVRRKLGAAETSSPTLLWILAVVVVVAVGAGVLLKRAASDPS